MLQGFLEFDLKIEEMGSPHPSSTHEALQFGWALSALGLLVPAGSQGTVTPHQAVPALAPEPSSCALHFTRSINPFRTPWVFSIFFLLFRFWRTK